MVHHLKRALFGRDYTEELKTCRDGLIDCVAQIRQQYQELQSATNEMTQMLDAVSGFLWKKDRHGRYQFANRAFCDRILVPDFADQRCPSDSNPMERVEGKVDEVLFDAYTVRTGKPHSLAQTMKAADAYVVETGQICRLLELGMIGNNPIMLKSTRTPAFDSEGNFDGIVGFAMDESEWWPDLRQGIDWYLADEDTRQIGPGVYLLRQKPNSPSQEHEVINVAFGAANNRGDEPNVSALLAK